MNKPDPRDAALCPETVDKIWIEKDEVKYCIPIHNISGKHCVRMGEWTYLDINQYMEQMSQQGWRVIEEVSAEEIKKVREEIDAITAGEGEKHESA